MELRISFVAFSQRSGYFFHFSTPNLRTALKTLVFEIFVAQQN